MSLSAGHAATTTHDSFTRVPVGSNGLDVAVDCRRLLGVVRSLPDGPVNVEQRGHDVVLTGGRATFRLAGVDPTLYPALPAHDGLTALQQDELGDVTGLAARIDLERFGVLLQWGEGQFGLAATDGYRLLLHGRLIDGNERAIMYGTGLRALAATDVTAIGATGDWLFFADASGGIVGARCKDVVVATKCPSYGSVASIVDSCEKSLAALRTDWIDVYQLHGLSSRSQVLGF